MYEKEDDDYQNNTFCIGATDLKNQKEQSPEKTPTEEIATQLE